MVEVSAPTVVVVEAGLVVRVLALPLVTGALARRHRFRAFLLLMLAVVAAQFAPL